MKLLVLSFVALVLVTNGDDNANAESVIPTKTEYERYLDQILLVFDKDPKVKEILKNATPQDIKNGVIEKTLRRLHPDIRSKLDEVKRNIIMEYRQKLRRAKMDDKVPEDLYKFQDEDLKHLLKERHDRLSQMNEERKRQFKKYEMEKELKHRMALRAMNEYDRKVQEALDEEEKQKKMEHAKNIKHPGNKAQLEEVWENEGFDKASFNPKTFFKMHDVNNDGEWDDFEVEAIFEKEVEELFEGLDADEEEMDEEVSRMREHVVEHIDKDQDGVIQLNEFIEYANSKDFDHEDPWDAAFAADFSDEDLDDFEKGLDDSEIEDVKAQAELEKQKRLETIKKYEEESKINIQMLKEHSEKLKEALLAANKAKDLEKAKKLVAESQAKEQAQASAEELARQQEEAAERERQANLLKEQEQARIQAEQQRVAEQQRQIQIQQEEQRQAALQAHQQQQAEAEEKARQAKIQAEEQQRQAEIRAEQQRQQEIQAEQKRQAEIQAEQQRQQEIIAEQKRQAEIQAEQQRQQQAQELQRQQEEHKKELEAQLQALQMANANVQPEQ